MTSGAAAHGSATPSPWIVRFAHLVAAGARVLDVASGEGRHARFLAKRGAHVIAVDRDASAMAALDGVERVTTVVADLEQDAWPFSERFDAIVVVNYLHRALLPRIIESLAADGVLLYETFARGNEAYGRPRNPDFLLRPDELIEYVSPRLTVVAFEQGHVRDGALDRVVQRIAAVGHARSWPPALDTAPGETALDY